MSNNTKFKKIILISLMLALLVIFFGIYFFVEKNQEFKSSSVSNVTIPSTFTNEKNEEIDLSWTDDNENENLIIRSDKKEYAGIDRIKIYFSITNITSQEHEINLRFLFSDKEAGLNSIKKIENGKENQLEKSSNGEERKATENFAVSFLSKDVIDGGQTNYYSAIINYPENSKGEFHIEAFNDNGAYGLLDPWYSSGLVGHWTFDGSNINWSTNTATDSSGSGNNGTITNMTSADSVIGKHGQALDFDGSNDYVNLGSASAVDDIETKGGGGMTISAWINPRTAGEYNQGNIVGKSTQVDTGQGSWVLSLDGSAIVFEKGYATTLLRTKTLSNAWKANTWQHLLVTWDGSSSASNAHMYLDGVEVSYNLRQDGVGSKLSDSSWSLNVGGLFRTFNGSIDDVRIYNRVLSSSEIQQIYTKDQAKRNMSLVGRATNGLVGHWTFDGSNINWSTNTATDSSGSGNNGTITSMTSADSVIGKHSQALDFDGVDDLINFGSDIDLVSKSFTLSAWAKRESFGTYDIIFGQGTGSTNYSLHVGFRNSNTFTCAFWSNDLNTGFTIINSDWHHWVCTYDAATNKRIIYEDGISVANNTATSDFLGSGNFYISDSRVDADQFDGKIDDARVYNRALSADEIADLYNLGKAKMNMSLNNKMTDGLVGQWSFDGPDINWSTNTATDNSGSGNNGTITNMTSADSVIGKHGQALDFDGVDDYVNLGSPASLNDIETQGGGGMTGAMWFNSKPSGGEYTQGVLFSKGDWGPSTSDGDWRFNFASQHGNIRFQKSFSTTILSVVSSNYQFSYNTWNHVIFTWDGSSSADNVHFYINGSEVSYVTKQNGVGAKVSDAVRTLSISRDGGAFDGSIDDARIYNRVLSASEITRLYNLGKVKYSN